MTVKYLLCCGSALIAFSGLASSAHAQSAPADQVADDSNVIVVTAQKRNERLIDVPVSISAIDNESLINQNLTTLDSMYSRIPGLQVSGDSTSQVSVRGISTGGRGNPTVAIIVDDVPYGSSTYLGASLVPDFDPAVLSRIEVLRGPQGTLYGASSLGGLIKYVTRAPDTKSFSGRVEVGANSVSDGGYGNSLRGSLNVPIVEDRVALLVNGFYNRDPAWIDDISSGSVHKDANHSKSWGGRAALLVKPIDGLTLNFSAMRQRNNISGETAILGTSGDDYTPLTGDKRTTSLAGSDGRRKNDLYTARADVDLPFAKLTSISAWGRTDVSSRSNTTDIFGFLSAFYPAAETVFLGDASSLRKFSQEVRLANEGAVLSWLVGGFYTVEHTDIPQSVNLYDANNTFIATPYQALSPSSYREYSSFADVTWHATSKIDVQVGGRYASNKQKYTSESVVDSPVVDIFGPSSSVSTNSKDHAFTWLVSPSYKFTPDSMIYARVATGYRPGGPNPVLPGIPRTFESDKVTNWEIGFKGQTSDRLLTYDVDVFQIDWKDIQLQSYDTATQFSYFSNGSKARSRGAEAALGIHPLHGLSFDMNGAYTDATLREDLPAPQAGSTGVVGLKGDRLPAVAKFTGSFSGQYDFALTSSTNAFVGGTLVYMGRRLGTFLNNGGTERANIPSYTTVDLRAGVSIAKSWELSVYVRNAFDKDGLMTVSNNGGSLTNPRLYYIQPRTIGFNISASF